MTTLITKATYRNGVIIPKTKPPFGKPDEVLVTYRFKSGPGKDLGNAYATLAVLKRYEGILPKTFPAGAAYIAKLRKKLAKDWEKRLKL